MINFFAGLMICMVVASGCSEHWEPIQCTGSMEPTMTCLDELKFDFSAPKQDIKIGTIIVFEHNAPCFAALAPTLTGLNAVEIPYDVPIVHRVVGITNEGYLTKGDNAPPDVCPVAFENVKAIVTHVRRDVYPENAELRNKVLAALERLEEAESTYWRTGGGYKNLDGRPRVLTAGLGLPPTRKNLALSRRTTAQKLYWSKARRGGSHDRA